MKWDRVAANFLTGVNKGLTQRGLERSIFDLLSSMTPDDIYLLIKSNVSLIGLADVQAQERIRNICANMPEWIDQALSEQYITQKIGASRPELLGIVTNTPNGPDWLRRQIIEAREAFLT